MRVIKAREDREVAASQGGADGGRVGSRLRPTCTDEHVEKIKRRGW